MKQFLRLAFAQQWVKLQVFVHLIALFHHCFPSYLIPFDWLAQHLEVSAENGSNLID
jgi:hypothetical protein